MSLFINDAWSSASQASAAAPAHPTDGTFSVVMIAAMFVLFYFMLIRPQNKRAKEHRQMMDQLKKGDEIITTSGILAKVIQVDDQYMKVAVSDSVEIHMQRSAVSAVLPKGTLKSV